MKKLLVFIFTAVLSLQGYTLNWANYSLIDPANDVTRSMAYNPETDHLLVATRYGGARIAVVNAEDGTVLGNLDSTSLKFEGGTYPVNQVSIADDGVIYVCNLHAPAATAGSTFRIYKYDNEESAPTLIFNDALEDVRYGDSFTAVGSGTDTYIYASGYQSDKMVVLKVGARGAEVVKTVQLPSPNAARHAIKPVSPTGNIWINGAGDSTPPIRLIDNDGNLLTQVPDSLISPGGSAGVEFWSVGDMHFLTAVNVFTSNSVKSVRYYEDELGTVTFDYFGWNSDSLLLAYNGTSLNNNSNGSNTIIYNKMRHSLFVLNGVNSIVSVDLNSLLNVFTPRDSGLLAVELDGKNREYTDYDHLGNSAGRDLYCTWGEQILTFALNGNSLYAPYEYRRLYVAIDFDLGGGTGSRLLPEEPSSIGLLPADFAADRVIAVNSDDFPDLTSNDPGDKWTDGTVYNWNGSDWTSSAIDGFDINYGAMAIIGDGTDSLITEVGLAIDEKWKTAGKKGILVYLAETDREGSVLSVFPDINNTGNGVSFNSWFEVDSLGQGMYSARDLTVNGLVSSTEPLSIAQEMQLFGNYPNPFNPTTTIRYELSRRAAVTLSVYNLRGELISTYRPGLKEAGMHSWTFSGADLSSGVYFCRLDANGLGSSVIKMMLLK